MSEETPSRKLTAREKIALRRKNKNKSKLISSPSGDDADINKSGVGASRSGVKKRMSRFGGADPLKNAKQNPNVKGTGGISPKGKKKNNNVDVPNENNDESDGASDTDDSDTEDMTIEESKRRLLASRGMVKSGFSDIDFNLQFHGRDGDHEDIVMHPVHDSKMYEEHGISAHSNRSAISATASEGLYVSASTSFVSNTAKDRNTGRLLREVVRHEDQVLRVKKVKNPGNDPDMPAFNVRTGHIQCPPHGTMEAEIFHKGEIKHADLLHQQSLKRPLRMNDSDGVGTFEEPLPTRKNILVKRSKPIYTLKNHQNKLSRLQVSIGVIGFDDHPLFILEDKLASKLRWIFAEYTREMRKNAACHIAERILQVVSSFLQQYKDVNDHNLHDHNRGEKLRRNAIDLIEEISKYGAQNETDLELNKQVYTCWEALKVQRKKQEFTSTSLTMRAKESKQSKLHNNAMQAISKVKRVFMDFFPIMKKYKATSDTTMERFDEVFERIRENVKLISSRKQFVFLLEESASKTATEMCPPKEQARRKKIQNLRIFGKLYLNGKKVGKTKEVSFLSGFRARMAYSFHIDLYHQPTNIKLKICERNVSIPGKLHEVFGNVFLVVPGAKSGDNSEVAPSLMAYDVDNSRNWRPFFTEKKYPKPELTTCQELDLEYSPPDEEKAQLLEREILETVQTELRTWRENEVGARRGAVTTRLARNTGNALKTTLEEFEKALRGEMEFDENAYRSKLKTTPNLQGLFENKSLHGFPINCPFTDMKSIVEKVRDTNIHCNEAKDVKFACAVKVFPYPNEIFSVWVFLLSECAKQNRV